MIVVSDTSCISNLLLINQLDLSQKIYSEIYIPPSVYNEILMLEQDGQDLSYFKSKDWIVVESNFTKNISLSPPKHIDAGEAEAIDLAIYLKADRLLIDERKGTLLANELGDNHNWFIRRAGSCQRKQFYFSSKNITGSINTK